ncbi:hypothetical protein GCM10008014_30380 [Paenibacillus silvae]|uniref:Uncharacterized protein n=1 Tax=Paenibacillus silvae TaxID=1325358 RepID=A0ABQ1ZFZ4_9BACL|nr:DUF6492 family protein [Paenibacillus silvae]GGH58097.1 hypothetical protein GCM10008014_30380 [Paenibacillus silvae]
MDKLEKIDVLICAARNDINFILEYAIKSCIQNFKPLKRIYIVTPDPDEIDRKLEEWQIDKEQIVLLNDSEVLTAEMMNLPGWLKQQIIKLQVEQICSTRYVCCFGADTVMLKPVTYDELFENDKAVLYFNRYSTPGIHLHYERKRVENISEILQTTPKRAFLLGDFIMELMIFDCQYLRSLMNYLNQLYGNNALASVVPDSCDTYSEKTAFGEWTLYAVYILDVLNDSVPIRNSECKFVRHLHSANDLRRFQYDCHVAHFVNKSFDTIELTRRFEAMGIGA